MKKLLSVLLALACLPFAPRIYGADAKVQLQELVAKVKTKLQAGNPTEQDLAPELQDFDTLLAEHKGEKTDDVAHILFMKGMLYAQVLNDYPKATTASRHRGCRQSRPNPRFLHATRGIQEGSGQFGRRDTIPGFRRAGSRWQTALGRQ
jgi:hypothetical protein